MAQETWNTELQGVLDKASVSLNYSIDHVVEIREEVRTGVRDMEKDLRALQQEVLEVIEASESVAEAYRKARGNLARAAERGAECPERMMEIERVRRWLRRSN